MGRLYTGYGTSILHNEKNYLKNTQLYGMLQDKTKYAVYIDTRDPRKDRHKVNLKCSLKFDLFTTYVLAKSKFESTTIPYVIIRFFLPSPPHILFTCT